jgi:hypothetical protein
MSLIPSFSPSLHSLPREFHVLDRFLGKHVLVIANQLAVTIGDELARPCMLVCTALWFEARRSLLQRPWPPTTHWHLQPEYLPVQLQRFLRGCVAAAAQRLVKPLGDECVCARTMMIWENRIFTRVMSGFVSRVEVRLQGTRACRRSRGCTRGVTACIYTYIYISFENIIDTLFRSKQNLASGCVDQPFSGCNRAVECRFSSFSLPSPFLCRLSPLPESQINQAFTKQLNAVMSISFNII